jgi:hypothetical protein
VTCKYFAVTTIIFERELTGKISTAPLSGFFERTVPVTFGVADADFVLEMADRVAADVMILRNEVF